MFFVKSTKKASKPLATWISVNAGYDKTKSPELIRMSLERLKNSRVFITLLCGEYQSGNSVLIGFDDKQLYLDKPPDWPGIAEGLLVQIVFKDDQRLWNYYNTSRVSESENTVVVTFPSSLYRLQRRTNYRVTPPLGSNVSLTQTDKTYNNITIRDISLSGMLICMHYSQKLNVGGIEKLIITLKSSQDTGESIRLTLAAGSVVRRLYDEECRENCYGISFKIDGKNKEALMRYIRQREIVLLRNSLPKR